MHSDSQILISLHEKFESQFGGPVSLLSFDIGPQVAHTRYSKTFQAVLGRPRGPSYLLEVVETGRLRDPVDFLQCAILMVQMSHPNIAKIHTIFEEDEKLFLVKEDCEVAVGHNPEWIRKLPVSVYGELLGQLLAALAYFNGLGIPGMTLNVRPKHLLWSKGVLKVGRLMSLNRMYAKQNYGYFSVPECESTKEKIEVWNLGLFLLDLATAQNVRPVPRGDPLAKLTDQIPRRSSFDPEVRQVITACLREFPERTGLDDLRRCKLVRWDPSLPQIKTSNSFSLDQKNTFPEASEPPKPSIVSFEFSNKQSDVFTREKRLSIRPEKAEKERVLLAERIAELEKRLQSLAEFRRRTEEQCYIFGREGKSVPADKNTIEVILENAKRSVN